VSCEDGQQLVTTTTAYDRLLDALRGHGSTVNENGHGKATA
jgi:hypothetical protein